MISVFEAEELLRAAASGDFPEAGDLLRRGDDRWVFGPITTDDFSINFDDIDGIIEDRLQLPAEIAYEDEVNTFLLDQTFSANLTLAAATILTWGGDTDLFRASANLLKTNDSFTVGVDLIVGVNATVIGDLTVDTDTLHIDSATSRVGVGTTSPAEILHITRPTGIVRVEIEAQAAGANSILKLTASPNFWEIQVDGTSAELIFDRGGTELLRLDGFGVMTFGVAKDTNLFRDAANVLKTDDAFIVGSTFQSIGLATFDKGIAVTGQSLLNNETGISASGASGDLRLNTFGINRVVINSSTGISTFLFDVTVTKVSANSILTMSRTSTGLSTVQLQSNNANVALLGVLLNVPLILGANNAEGLRINGDVAPDVRIANTLFFGVAQDTNLFRDSANVLKTDDAFVIGLGLTVGTNITLSSSGVITWGADTNLFRDSASLLRTNDSFRVDGSMGVGGPIISGVELAVHGIDGFAELRLKGLPGSGGTVEFFNDVTKLADIFANIAKELTFRTNGATTGLLIDVAQVLWIGSVRDTNLFRDSANVLKTDDAFIVGSTFAVTGTSVFTGKVGMGQAASSPMLTLLIPDPGTIVVQARHSHATNMFGIDVFFTAGAPDDRVKWFYRGQDSGGVKLNIWSDGGATFGGAVHLPNGTESLPSLANTGDEDTGLWWSGGNELTFVSAASGRVSIDGSRLNLRSTQVLGWTSGSPQAGAVDTNLFRDSANVLKTDDAFIVTGLITALAGIATNGNLFVTSATSGISLSGGSSGSLGANIVLFGETHATKADLLEYRHNTTIRATFDLSLDTLVFTSTDVTIGGFLEIDGDLNHDGSNVGFMGVAPQAQQAHIVDADGTLADITTKFNTLLADLEGYGLLAVA